MTAARQPRRQGWNASRAIGSFAMRMLLAVVGFLYFHQAGTVTGFLPFSQHATLWLVGGYLLTNLLLLAAGSRLDAFTVDLLMVIFDLAMLTVIVLQDPYPAAPVAILLLSTVLDYSHRLDRAGFSGVTAAIFLILLANAWARAGSGAGFAPEGVWLSVAIGALILNYYLAALASARARADRRQFSAELDELRRREHEAMSSQLRAAQITQKLRFKGLPRERYAEQALGHLTRDFGGCAAALYQRVEDAAGVALVPLATYAVDLPRLHHQRVGLDQSLLGTCASQRRMIELHPVPPGYFDIVSGLGQVSPSHLYLFPLSFHEELAGVMELALLRQLSEDDLKLLDQLTETLAAGLVLPARAG